MPARTQEIDLPTALSLLAGRVGQLETTAKRRCLPPGYEWSFTTSGQLVVTRVSDGAEQVVAF